MTATAAPDTEFLSRRAVMLGIGSAATAALAGLVTPRHYAPGVNQIRLDEVVPAFVGPWRAQPSGAFILPQDAPAATAYDQIIARRFAAPTGPDIMLVIAHGAAQSGLMRVHRPEICYTSEGFQIRDFHSLDLTVARAQTIPAQTFVGVRDDRVESVLYWTRIAGFFPRDLMAQRLIMLRLGLEGLIPDGVLVRISALGAGEAGPAMTQFARDLVRQSSAEGRALLLGPQDSRSLT